MQAGIISEENLAQILRGISQKRRHGVLEVHAGDKIVEIAFFQGKIVDVIERRQPLARRMALRLARRGLLSDGDWIAAIETREQLLAEVARQGEKIDSDVIQFVQQQQALDDLYGLDLVDGSYYHFRVEMIDTPAEEDLQLSVGQLLLDLVAIKEGRDTFRTRFPDSLVLGLARVSNDGAGIEERDLIGLVSDGCSVAHLRSHTLLGRLCFEETITHLVDSGILKDGAEKPRTELAFDLSSLDASIDQYAADACSSLEVDEADRSPQASPQAHPTQEQFRESTLAEGESTSAALKSPETTAVSGLAFFAELNRRLLESSYTPEIVLGFFVSMAFILPLLLW